MERNEKYPPINQRILDIVNNKFDGNVRQFSLSMGLNDSAKINRLFKKDSRSGEYPTPSTDIVILISNAFDISTDWILKGVEHNSKTNNINIETHRIQGDKNIVGDNNVQSTDDVMSIIKSQQEQITRLLNIITNGK